MFKGFLLIEMGIKRKVDVTEELNMLRIKKKKLLHHLNWEVIRDQDMLICLHLVVLFKGLQLDMVLNSFDEF